MSTPPSTSSSFEPQPPPGLGGDVVPSAAPAAKASLALRFRILKRGGWKVGFRLEERFWEVLEQAAKSGGVRLTDYVRDVIERLGGGAQNQSSALRVEAIDFLLERCRSLEKTGDVANIVGAALAAPVPCFVLNAARKLESHNREFHNLVVAAAQQLAEGGASSANLTLDVPVPKLIELLAAKPNGALICGYSIRVNTQLVRGKAKVALAVGRDQSVLVGYILDSRISS